MTTYTIKTRACNNAHGECFQVFQLNDGREVYYVGTFTRRCWAEAWIADMLADLAGR
jgi:hypothetical protein